MHQLIRVFHPQLHQLEQQINAEFKLRRGTILDYISLPDPRVNLVEYYLPALMVLLFGRGATDSSRKVVDMGCVVQFIYLGTKVHSHLSEDDDATTQYPILVGDYLYGKFYTTLCQADCLHFLAPLSQAIMTIHQTSIQEKDQLVHANNKFKTMELYQEKWGQFFGLCCTTGLLVKNNLSSKQVSDRLDEDLDLVQQVGLALGVCYGLLTAEVQNPEWINEARDQVLGKCKRIGDPLITQTISLILDSLHDELVSKHLITHQSILVG